MKFGLNGGVVWAKNFGGSDSDKFISVASDGDGFIAAGWSKAGSFGNGDWDGLTGKGANDGVLVKFDKNGGLIWKTNFGGGNGDFFHAVISVSGGYVAIGNSKSGSSGSGDWIGATAKGSQDGIIVKFDSK